MATYSQGMVDAILTAMATRFNNAGGSAVLEFYSSGNVLLASHTLAATPFGVVGAGATGYRQINATGLPLSAAGAAGAGSGVAISYALAKNEAGASDGKLTVGLTGSGADIEVSNTNIASGQTFNVTGYGFRMAYDSTL